MSPDGTKAATSAWDEPLRLWDLETGRSLGAFGSGRFAQRALHIADFHPTEPHLLVTTPPDQVRIHTLDIDELIEIAEVETEPRHDRAGVPAVLPRPMPDGSSGQLTPPGEVDLSDEVSDASSSLGKSDPEAADIGAIPTQSFR